MAANTQPLSPQDYNTFTRFDEDELFVARQASRKYDLPTIATQLQVKTLRVSKDKGARELFAGICVKLDLHRLGSEKAQLRAVGESYDKFADMCRVSARPVAKRGSPTSNQNGKPRSGGNSPEAPLDIIAHYKLDLDVLADRVDSLPRRLKSTLTHFRTGEETREEMADRLSINANGVSRNFNEIYKTLEIRHIRVLKHRRIITHLAHQHSARRNR